MSVIKRVTARFRITIKDLRIQKSGKKNYTRTLSLDEGDGADIDSIKRMIEQCFNHAEYKDHQGRKDSPQKRDNAKIK